MLDYSEYKSLVEVLEKSELDDTYKDLMKKEDKVLDTVNNVVNHYKDERYKEKSFVHMSLNEIYKVLFIEYHEFVKDITNIKDVNSLTFIVLKGSRPIYIGIVLILIAFLLFFISTSK